MRLGLNGRFYGVPTWGVQRFAREISIRLGRWPHDLRVFLPQGVRPGSSDLPGTPVEGTLPGHLWEHAELPWRGRRAGCDVLLHMSGTAPWWGGPNVMVLHDVFPLTNPEWFSAAYAAWFRRTVAPAARRAAVVVAPSRWTRSRIAETLKVPLHRIRVVGQGTRPFTAPAPADAVREVRDRYALPDCYVLAVGGGDRRKNTGFLLSVLERWDRRAARRTGASLRRPALVVVGERRGRVHGAVLARGWGERRRGSQIASGEDGRLRRLGHVSDEDLRALYTGARVFCFPSLGEGFGRPPLEAMACGTPAVVADYAAAREVLGDAARIEPLAPEAWVEAVSELMEDGEERRRRVRRGRKQARRWSWDEAARRMEAVCRQVAEGP